MCLRNTHKSDKIRTYIYKYVIREISKGIKEFIKWLFKPPSESCRREVELVRLFTELSNLLVSFHCTNNSGSAVMSLL